MAKLRIVTDKGITRLYVGSEELDDAISISFSDLDAQQGRRVTIVVGGFEFDTEGAHDAN